MVRIITSSVSCQEGFKFVGFLKNEFLEWIWLGLYILSLSEAAKRVGFKNATPMR